MVERKDRFVVKAAEKVAGKHGRVFTKLVTPAVLGFDYRLALVEDSPGKEDAGTAKIYALCTAAGEVGGVIAVAMGNVLPGLALYGVSRFFNLVNEGKLQQIRDRNYLRKLTS